MSASFSYLKGPRVFKIHREADVLHFLEVNSMCASLPGWTPALQSLPGLESKEVKRSSWEAGVYIVYVYIYIHNSVYGSQTDIPKTHTHTHTETSPLLGGLIHCQRCKDTVFLQRVLNVIDVIDGLSMPRCVLVTYFDIRCAQRLMLSSPGRCEPFPPVRKGDQGSRGVTRGHEGSRGVTRGDDRFS